MEQKLEKALWHLKQGQLDEAEKMLKEYLDLDPDNALAHNKLGVIFAERQSFSEAKKEFERVLELEPQSANALNNLGNLEREEGNFTAAKEYYSKAIEIDPEYAVAHNNLAVIYKQLNQYREFVKEMKLAKKLERKQALNPQGFKSLRQVWENFRSRKKREERP